MLGRDFRLCVICTFLLTCTIVSADSSAIMVGAVEAG